MAPVLISCPLPRWIQQLAIFGLHPAAGWVLWREFLTGRNPKSVPDGAPVTMPAGAVPLLGGIDEVSLSPAPHLGSRMKIHIIWIRRRRRLASCPPWGRRRGNWRRRCAGFEWMAPVLVACVCGCAVRQVALFGYPLFRCSAARVRLFVGGSSPSSLGGKG